MSDKLTTLITSIRDALDVWLDDVAPVDEVPPVDPPPTDPPVTQSNPYNAEGFGAVTRGGYGAAEVHVTRMDDPTFTAAQYNARTHLTPGTLRWAMAQPGPKQIVFDQPGTIRLWCPIQETTLTGNLTFNATRQPVTVLGQLRLDNLDGAETVWLNTRFRAALWNNGYRPFAGGPQSSGDCLLMSHGGNCLIDHCEFSGSADELFNYVYGKGHVTIQWSVFCEAFQRGDFNVAWGDDFGHNYGGLLNWSAADNAFGFSLHHCYFANLAKRMPTEMPSTLGNPPTQYIEVIDNLFYNWREFAGGYRGRDGASYHGNTWQFGPSATSKALNGSVGYGQAAHASDNVIIRGAKRMELWDAGNNTMRGATLLDAELPQWHDATVTIQEREAAIALVLAEAGVKPFDNLSRANRDCYAAGTGWQGAHPDYKAGSLDDYLAWATGT